jgi:large subunit ribosomal protein L21
MSVSYAVIEAGGTQYRVAKGEVIRVPSLRADVGSTVEFKPLVINDGENIIIGNPLVENALVRCSILDSGRSRKLVVFKFRRRKHYRRKKGHRKDYTTIRIDDITTA